MKKRDFAGIGDGCLDEKESKFRVLKQHHSDLDNRGPQTTSSAAIIKARENITLDVIFNDVLLDWGQLPSSLPTTATGKGGRSEASPFQMNGVAVSEQREMRIWVLERPSLRVLSVWLGKAADERFGVSYF